MGGLGLCAVDPSYLRQYRVHLWSRDSQHPLFFDHALQHTLQRLTILPHTVPRFAVVIVTRQPCFPFIAKTAKFFEHPNKELGRVWLPG